MVRYDAAENFRIFIKSCGVGFLLGAVHCFFAAVFGVRRRDGALRAAGDILFFVFACAATFVFLLDANNGFFRAFIALGEGAGFLVFLLLLEKYVLRVFFAAAEKSRNVLRAVRKAVVFRFDRHRERASLRRTRKKNQKTHKKSNKTLAYKQEHDI